MLFDPSYRHETFNPTSQEDATPNLDPNPNLTRTLTQPVPRPNPYPDLTRILTPPELSHHPFIMPFSFSSSSLIPPQYRLPPHILSLALQDRVILNIPPHILPLALQDRVILNIDVFHPELSALECEAIQLTIDLKKQLFGSTEEELHETRR